MNFAYRESGILLGKKQKYVSVGGAYTLVSHDDARRCFALCFVGRSAHRAICDIRTDEQAPRCECP